MKLNGSFKNGFGWLRMKRSISLKLRLFSILLLLLPTVIVGYSSYAVSKKETEQLVRQNLQNNVKTTTQTVSAFHSAVMSGSSTLEEAQESMKTMLLGGKVPDGTRPGNKNIDLGEHGYFVILDAQGNVLGHTQNVEGTNIAGSMDADGKAYVQELLENGLGGGGFAEFAQEHPKTGQNSEWIAYAEKTTYWGWIIVANALKEDFSSAQQNIVNAIIVSLIVSLIAGLAAALLFSYHISKPIALIAGQTKRIAAGDLNVPELQVRNRDETGQLAADFNMMTRNLKTLIQQVMVSSEHVTTASSTLNVAVTELTQTSRHIGESIQEIASGIEVQANGTEQSTQSMEEMTIGIRRIADSSAQSYEISLQSENEAKLGNEMIGQSIDQMQRIRGSVSNIVSIIENLSTHSREIGDIVKVMNDISTQTSLLSLNASIEASRAGEHGRGFAVVAAEIKKLADMSKSSAKDIIDKVQSIQENVETAVDSIRSGENEVEQGVSVIQKTGDAFNNIVEAAVKAVVQIQETSAAAEQLSASTEQIYASLREIERIANDSSASAQSISASSEEQIASMEEVAQSAAGLAEMAEKLREAAAKFKV